MGQKRRTIRQFSASPFKSDENPLNRTEDIIRRTVWRRLPPATRWGWGSFLCFHTGENGFGSAALGAGAAPEFRGFRHPSAIGDCKAASPKETLQAPSLRAPKVVTTRVYSPAKTSPRIAPSGSGVL